MSKSVQKTSLSALVGDAIAVTLTINHSGFVWRPEVRFLGLKIRCWVHKVGARPQKCPKTTKKLVSTITQKAALSALVGHPRTVTFAINHSWLPQQATTVWFSLSRSYVIHFFPKCHPFLFTSPAAPRLDSLTFLTWPSCLCLLSQSWLSHFLQSSSPFIFISSFALPSWVSN